MVARVVAGMASTLINPVEDRKRLARRLAGSGRGFAEQYGFRVTNNPATERALLADLYAELTD
ncbi:hypothetical protein [Micromonospora sp. NPDC049102]|uniref:hypothetical protein n=1 Tax=Micromonospora sp. NPDC049102 TaxID=3364265 RepID=UPI003711A5A1